MKTITICGSMTFYNRMVELKQKLEKLGWNVFIPTEEETKFKDMSLEEKIRAKKQYIEEHLNKIKDSNLVLIANFTKNKIQGYVGANTLIEIAFSRVLEKPLFFLEEPDEQGCIDELRGFDFKIISDLEDLK
ncbi:MAG: hypothetical protein N4A33_10865 [Bacteriovoracaceae bacterium]|jgi:nucleoside 2-deoxyribosyltransferase|nr:hypothetical protein [Bacteriovoracaceae bacterium]